MLRNSVPKALKLLGEEEAEESAIMADYFNTFFDFQNVASFSAGKLDIYSRRLIQVERTFISEYAK